MIDVLIEFKDPNDAPYNETLKAELVEGQHLIVELKEHATFTPFAAGDQVVIDAENKLVGIHRLEKVYVYSVHCHLPADTSFGKVPTEEHPAMIAMAALFEEWRRETWVTRTTGFTFMLSAQSQGWFKDRVEGNPYVSFTDLVRTPTMQFEVDEVLARHPTVGGANWLL